MRGRKSRLVCLNTSVPQVEADEGAQGKSSPQVSLLYMHSVAVFDPYITSNKKKNGRINTHHLFHFILLFRCWHLCMSSECLNFPSV